MTETEKCPRCGGPLLDDPEDDPGLSLFPEGTDVFVCMSCAADQAVRFVFADEVVPVHEWPIREGAHDHIAIHDLDPDRPKG